MPLLDVPYREVTIEGVSVSCILTNILFINTVHTTEGPVPGGQQRHQAPGDNPH